MTNKTASEPSGKPAAPLAERLKLASGWRRRSLSRRLVLVAAGWSVLALAIAWVILVGLYRTASERAFDAQLEVYAKTILSEMVPDATSADVPRETQAMLAVQAPKGIIEPRFSLPLSGWYWTVRSGETGRILFASPSLVGDPLTVASLEGEEAQSAFGTGPGGEELRVRQQRVRFGNATYIIAVAAGTAGFRADLAQFTQMAALTLAVIGAGLTGAVFLQVRIGLKPLVRLQASLAAVRRGDEETIDEDLPVEIAPLAVELNALIHSNREIVERARTHVGNLAHGLKTPLSVISNEARAAQGPLADKVSEQAAIMSTQIQHHLERARMAAQRRVIGVSCDVDPVLGRLCRAMGKIYQDRGIQLSQSVPAGLRFRGEQQDLEELSGNLIDNACKWAKGRVTVSVQPLAQSGVGRELFELVVEDDGPGLSQEERREAVKRGRRLDETVPGTGLGLSIVADLAALYGGRLDLDRSVMGGLKASLVLPAI
ncbi:ATP-binding protein [Roseibium suaedae]|uniref:histidine kinase n=1 Tax=Roseibium suaedae TaxID=735517 RepID=A0A1M7CE36_9HYPH|nr:ATP-binding protein [Roseibium suaedae]SHL65436.1 signal transduction histidine kinase [Roseibium suaedae]